MLLGVVVGERVGHFDGIVEGWMLGFFEGRMEGWIEGCTKKMDGCNDGMAERLIVASRLGVPDG